ncbi:MAG: thiolase family protein [Candidatus Eisenbacteria bacterium]
MQTEDPIVVVSALRTPIGRFFGALSGHTGVELGTLVVRKLLDGLGERATPTRVLLGSARQAGTRPNPARQVAIRAGLPETTIASTINMACASGLEAIADGARRILTGEAEFVVAGGIESMTRVPYLLDRARTGYRLGHGEVIDAMYRDGFDCPLAEQLMGETAETLANQYDISRAEQDQFALASQERAVHARDTGRFDDELVVVPNAKNPSDVALARDEHPRPGTSLESLAKLPPVFAKDGTITAGNASGITDGAAAVVLTTRSRAKALGLGVLATLRAYEVAGVDPRVMGIGPVPAVRTLLGKESLTLEEIDLVELNEAFAAQVIACDRELGFDRDRLNVNGGAIALGHPIGCTGARITVSLLHEMRRRDVRLGLSTLCVSGGLGMAMLFERG